MNTVGNLIDAYYELLKNSVPGFTVYKITVQEGETGNYIEIYPESGGDDNNKSSRVENVVVRIDLVTRFQNDVDQSACENADTAVRLLIANTVTGNGLQAAGLQVLNVKREDYAYQVERGDAVYYRKITRYSNRLRQN